MKRFLSRLTYANVVSTLCLFLFLGGGAAFAASRLAKNSVGTKQIKNNSVTASKIKNGAVTGAKIDLSTLGTVPKSTQATTATEAGHASVATRADSATTAASATTATNASELDGTPAAGYQKRSMWAYVSSGGEIEAQSGGISVQEHLGGSYFLHFPQEVLGKALVASPSGNLRPITLEAEVCGNTGGISVDCGAGTNTHSDALVLSWEGNGGGGLPNEEAANFYVTVTP